MDYKFVHVSCGGISECQQCQLSASYASPEEPSDNGKVVFKGDELRFTSFCHRFVLSLSILLKIGTGIDRRADKAFSVLCSRERQNDQLFKFLACHLVRRSMCVASLFYKVKESIWQIPQESTSPFFKIYLYC